MPWGATIASRNTRGGRKHPGIVNAKAWPTQKYRIIRDSCIECRVLGVRRRRESVLWNPDTRRSGRWVGVPRGLTCSVCLCAVCCLFQGEDGRCGDDPAHVNKRLQHYGEARLCRGVGQLEAGAQVVRIVALCEGGWVGWCEKKKKKEKLGLTERSNSAKACRQSWDAFLGCL